MNIKIHETHSDDEAFIQLVNELDKDLNARYGQLQDAYNQFNELEKLTKVVVLHLDDVPVACGGIKAINTDLVELKRVFVHERHRRKGFGRQVVEHLENLSGQLGYKAILLETGKKQTEAIDLYQKDGYEIIKNYGAYVDNDNSVCMRKILK